MNTKHFMFRPAAMALATCWLLATATASLAQQAPPAAPKPSATFNMAPPAGAARTTARAWRDPYAGKPKVLIVGDLQTGNQIAHDSVSHALATLERLGRSTGAYVAFLQTDTHLVTKGEVWGAGDYAKGGKRAAPGRNLDYFDAVVFYTNGETHMTPQQKADLLAFVRDDGKGFVAIHTAAISYDSWPEYANLICATFINHPWNVVDARVTVERPDSPIVKHLPASFLAREEFYQYGAPYGREQLDVLLSLDARHLDLAAPTVKRTDRDFPAAWTKRYGKGRVFVSTFGHTDESWDDARLQTMYVEAIRWALGQTQDEVKPHAAKPVADAELRQPAATPLGTGPYPATMSADPSLPGHTVYAPAVLSKVRGKLPVVVWGNGACVNMGNRFRYFLTEVASHGYLALAIGPPASPVMESSAELTPATADAAGPAVRQPKSDARQLNEAIDWAVAENTRRGSPYFGKLDTTKVAVMGQSCGGLQAIAAAAAEGASGKARVTTTVVWNSGTFPEGSANGGGLAGAPATKATLGALPGAVAYISGDESDIAFVNANDDAARINHVPVFRAYAKGVGHSGTYREPNGGDFARVAVAWLDFQLKGSKQAAKWFRGAECSLCRDPHWAVPRNTLP